MKLFFRNLTLLGFSLFFIFGSVEARDRPSLENLERAKQRVEAVRQMVNELIERSEGNYPDPDRNRCRRYDDPYSCNEANCYWNSHEETCERNDSGILENDQLARRLLIRINVTLEKLALRMDEATAVYFDDFLFWPKQQKVCRLDWQLIQANRGAKVASNLPVRGFLRPIDFDPIEDELIAIQDDFEC